MHTFQRAGWLLLAMLLAGCSATADRRALLLDAGNPAVATASAPPTQFVDAHAIIILRHADIDPAEKARLGNKTPLLPRGEQRAEEVVTALKEAGVTRIVTSTSLRTQETSRRWPRNCTAHPSSRSGTGQRQRAAGPGCRRHRKRIRCLHSWERPRNLRTRFCWWTIIR